MIGGFGFTVGEEDSKFIESNFCKLNFEPVDNKKPGYEVVRIEGPAVLAALVVRHKQAIHNLIAEDFMSLVDPCQKGLSFEYLLPIPMTDAFGTFEELGELFTFADNRFKHLEHVKVRGMCFIADHDGTIKVFPFSSKSGPCVQLVYKAGSPKEMNGAIKVPEGTPFYMPDKTDRGDLRSLVQEEKTGDLIELVVQAKYTAGKDGLGIRPTKKTWTAAINSLNAEHQYKHLDKDVRINFIFTS